MVLLALGSCMQHQCTSLVATQTKRGALGALGLPVPAGSGCWACWEDERRISASNSICWRTWTAPRQAENSTYGRTRTQCWLCPRRALPSCCAPHSPHIPPTGDRSWARGFFLWLLRESLFWPSSQMQSWSLVLSPSATFCVCHEVRPVPASPLLSPGAAHGRS